MVPWQDKEDCSIWASLMVIAPVFMKLVHRITVVNTIIYWHQTPLGHNYSPKVLHRPWIHLRARPLISHGDSKIKWTEIFQPKPTLNNRIVLLMPCSLKVWIKNRRQWSEFFAAIDWTQGENANYRKWPEEFRYDTKAPRGHLPLTNCLRGTQLFAEVMEHPAFLPSKSKSKAASATASNIGKAEFKI